jgi:hypothetical protein
MPKLPMDYSKCCIYKIEHIDDDTLVYVGHTTNFEKRKAQHKINCNYVNSGSYNLKVYQMIRENGDWEMFKMIEVEKYPCNDKREAERRENEVMKELKANMNTYSSFRTVEEMKEINNERCKEYNKNNKELVTEYKKKWGEKNKDKIKEKSKEYRQANKESINKRHKQYYEDNKDKIAEEKKIRTTCMCGCVVTKPMLKRHQASKKHLDKMKNLNSVQK